MAQSEADAEREQFVRDIRARHPAFLNAVLEDARVTALYRGERAEFRSRLDAGFQALRLAWQTDAFLAQALYRAKARMQALGVPLLPRIAHRLAMITGQVAIGDPVVIQPGVYLLHGQVVIDGITEIDAGTTIGPFVTIGLRHGDLVGPTVRANSHIGTGARVLGRISVGPDAQIGANAVVIADVPQGATVVGVPAKTPGNFAPIESEATSGTGR